MVASAFVVVVSAVASGCGDEARTGVSTGASSEVADDPSSPASTAAATSAPVDVEATTYTFTWTDAGGVEVEGTMELLPPMMADDPQIPAAWSQVYPQTPPDLACVENPDRDAVVLGTISFSNPTPEYTPANVQIGMFNYSSTGTGASLEIHYGDDVRCDTFSFAPAMDDASWGPVPIAFVVPLVYGPAGFDEGTYAAAQENLGFKDVEPGQNVGTGGTGSLIESFRLPPPASSSGGGADPESCDAIWIQGQTLPSDYDGCTLPDGSASADILTPCTDGTTLAQLDGYGYARLGERIAGGLGQDPAVEVASRMACES